MSMREWMAVVFVALLGLGPWVARPVEAAPLDDSSTALTVETEAKMFQGDDHRRWVQERGSALLRERSEPLDSRDQIVVELGGLAYEYRVTVRVLRDGQPIEPQPEPFVVEGPTEELLPRIDAAIEQAAEQLAALGRAEAEAQAAEQQRELQREQAAAQAEAEAEAAEQARESKRSRTRNIRIVGASLAGVGGAAMVSGIVMVAIGPRDYPDDNRLQSTVRPPGFAVLGAGGALAIAGASVLVWNHLRCRKAPDECGMTRQQESARVVPWMGPHGGGASIVGRF